MTTAHSKFAVAGLSAVAALVIGLVGCDSTPAPPTDAPPSVPKDVPPPGVKAGRQIPKSIKNRPVPTTPAP